MIKPEEVISIGTLRRVHGRSGELQCHATNELWENADAQFLILSLDAILVPFRVEDWRTKGAEDLLFRLKGIDSEQAAQRLVGAEAFMLRRDIVASGDDTLMTWQDLVGRRVVDTEQGGVGVIRSVDETTANTLIELEDGRLLPLHEDFIQAITDDTLTVTFPFML